ncbi:hypothetical protein C943_02035 [Mariniradius saccharolyticus AK6]|uniref:Uncharacterized protein n=1 Tax=Mariniradius saccharolyticus AK6 TaxID=1239962 RepID=M7XA34_9BACT|nr:hypothetical protein C943_02035 [Mariniradius saccharolyticus AK6]
MCRSKERKEKKQEKELAHEFSELLSIAKMHDFFGKSESRMRYETRVR